MTVLDDHDLVVMVTMMVAPAVMTVMIPEFGASAHPMMTVLDYHGLRAGDGRGRDGEADNRGNNVSKLVHENSPWKLPDDNRSRQKGFL